MSQIFNVRKYNPESDFNFIVNSWVKCYEASEWANHLKPGLYRVRHREQIERKLEQATMCLVAVNRHNDDQIYGYILGEGGDIDCIHFVYCKKIFRGIGVGKELFQSLRYDDKLEYSHFMPGLYRILKGRGIYNPYRFFS